MARQKSRSPLTRQLEIRRRQAGRLLSTTPLSKAEIARRLGVSRAAVTQWSQMMNYEGGEEALYAWERPGRPPRLSDADWRRVLRLIGRAPKFRGFLANCWTLNLIRQLIQREFDVSYSLSYLAEKLHALKWRTPKSKARHIRRETLKALRRRPEQDWGIQRKYGDRFA
jgi:transposase